MDKETLLRQKTDEMILLMPKWAEVCQVNPFSGVLLLYQFLETIYDAGAATQRVVIRGRDIQNTLNRDKERQQ